MDGFDVVVYTAVSGQSFQVHYCNKVKQMLKQVQKHTDWLWGVGKSFHVVDMQSNKEVSPHCQVSSGPSRYQIIYGLRISASGFPCFECKTFVPWEGWWFTRYHSFCRLHPSTNTKRNRRALYAPRDYFCPRCAAIIHDRRQGDQLETVFFRDGMYHAKSLRPDIELWYHFLYI